jgi:hypothetical protein
MSEERLAVSFEDFLALLRTAECGPGTDLSLLDQIIALWEEGLVILTLAQAAEILSVNEARLTAILAESRFPHAYLSAERGWLLPLDEVLAQPEIQSVATPKNKFATFF